MLKSGLSKHFHHFHPSGWKNYHSHLLEWISLVHFTLGIQNRQQVARYDYVCSRGVTRAVHLDIVTDLSTGTFIQCLKIFTARRGLLYKLISDNGKTLKVAAKATAALLNDKDVHEYLSSMTDEWCFNAGRLLWENGKSEIFEQNAWASNST